MERPQTAVATAKPTEEQLRGAINRDIAGAISISGKSGMVIDSMSQAMELAKLMSLARQAVPTHLRENPGACLAISIQAYDWQINPFALANKSYVVNDRLCYEASLYQSVVARRAPIVGRIKMEFTGAGDKRVCRVWAELSDGTGVVDYVSPEFGKIQPKNSPLWKNDPDQQLFYSSVRGFARRHFPDVMMGIYTADELIDSPEMVHQVEATVVDSRSKTERLAQRLLTPQTDTTATIESQVEPISNGEESQEQPAEDLLPYWLGVIAEAKDQPALMRKHESFDGIRADLTTEQQEQIEEAFAKRLGSFAETK